MRFNDKVVKLSLLALSNAQQVLLGAGGSSPLTPKFDEFVAQTLETWRVPGLSLAIIDGDEAFSKGYGIATFPSEKVTPSTLFYPGSTTKSFTAAAVSLLIDESANPSKPWAWDTPLSSIIREDFVMIDDYYTSHITLEDALSHRTGLPRHDGSFGGINFTVRDGVRNLRHLPITAEIRSRFQYCNLMFITVSHAIETFTKTWLGAFLLARIWKPLGMNSTFFSLPDALAGASAQNISLAQGYVWSNNTQSYIKSPWIDAPVLSGAGAVISNVDDYAKWIRCHMDKLPPLSAAAHSSFRQPRTIVSSESAGMFGPHLYSLGWFISNYRGETLIWHNGGMPGFGATMGYLPGRRWGFAAMGNTAATSNIAARILTCDLLDDFLGTPQEERFDWGAALGKQIQEQQELLRDPIGLIYPTTPRGKNKVPLALPLKEYAGYYIHPAYPNFNLTLATKTRIPADYATYERSKDVLLNELYLAGDYIVELEHVSGEYFIAYGGGAESFNRETSEFLPGQWNVSKAEFRLGPDGKVKEMGLLIEMEMGNEKIWFRRE
ncbi:MAG: hypothetical protein Q9217_004418 [Psora testacea]